MSVQGMSMAAGGSRTAAGSAADLLDLGLVFGILLVACDGLAVFRSVGPYLLYDFQWHVAAVLLLLLVRNRWRALGDGVVMAWPFALWAVLATMSALWSVAPAASAIGGVRLAVTIVMGVAIGLRAGPRLLLWLIFLALLPATLLSTLALATHQPFATIEGVPVGVLSHKNMLGQHAAFQFATGFVLLVAGRSRCLAPAAMLASLWLLAVTDSATARLVTAVTPFIYLCVSVVGRPPLALVLTTLLGVAGAALAVFLLAVLDVDVVREVLETVGRNDTLTGRTLLWRIGGAVIAEHPLLGIGFNAFWAADFHHQASFITRLLGDSVLHFHNDIVNVAVGMGALGVVALVGGMTVAVVKTLDHRRRVTDAVSAWPALMMLMVSVYALGEFVLMRELRMTQLLIVATLVSVTAARRAADRTGRPPGVR